MTSRSECVRGCLRPEVHLADCPASANPAEPCPIPRRCAGAVVLEGFVVCETCRKRIRGLLRIAPELLDRLWSQMEHGKAVVYSPVKTLNLRAAPPDAMDAEKLDAWTEISANIRDWSRWIDMRTLEGVDRILGDAEQTLRLAAAVIDAHIPDEQGGRHWSIVDAASRWGVERRDRSTFVYQDDADEIELLVNPIPEPRHDPLLITRDAAKRAQVTDRQLRNWVTAGELVPRATLRDGRGVMNRWFRQSEVDAAAERMRAAAVASRFRSRRAAPA